MYVKHLAWLQARPGEKQSISRLERFREQSEEHPALIMPETIGHEYLVGWLLELGIASFSGMGTAPLTFSEIYSWADGLELTPWEAKMIREMSVEYVSYAQKSADENYPPPFMPEKTQEQQVNLSKSFSSALKRHAKPKQKPVPIQNKRIKPACQI